MAATAAAVGLHSSDPATVYLSAWARVDGFRTEHLQAALYDKRALLRMLGMRRTMFVVDRELGAVMNAACTRALAASERRRLVKLVEDQGLTADGDAWLLQLEAATLDSLHDRGQATAAELKQDVPELAAKLHFGEGKRWAGSVGMTTRLMFLLATDAKVVRGRPRGSWLSSQYAWAPLDDWLEQPLPDWQARPAQAELIRRWLGAYGPGTEADVKWWTGWGVRETRRALEDADAVEVALDGGATGYLLPDDLEDADGEQGGVWLLPALDPLTMGWKQRDWYLGSHGPALFDRNGNAGPTVWHAGRIVGGWGQTEGGEVAVQLLEDVGREVRVRVDEAASALSAWLSGTVVKPRFRTPLEKELAGR